MKIGDFTPINNIFLAPMAGITDVIFRGICKEMGCGLTYSEMVSSKGIMYGNNNTEKLMEVGENEDKVAVQLFGSDPEILANMVQKLEHNEKIALFDINMGCPVHKIIKNGDGSALLKNPKLIAKIIKKVSNATYKPLTIKIRKGFDENSVNAIEVAKIAEENGAKAITIHGRTREQLYSGVSDIEIIKKVKESVSIPIIGNGDVIDGETAKYMLDYTKCDAIMIARKAQGNPFIFKEILHYIKTGEILQKPSREVKIKIAIKHTKLVIENKGEYVGIREMRKHLGWYIKGMPKSTDIRVLINKVESFEQIEKLLLSSI